MMNSEHMAGKARRGASHPNVLLCSDRVGYGHLRGMLAVEDALRRIGVPTQSVFASQASSTPYRWAWNLLDRSLRIPYSLFPERYARMSRGASANGMNSINAWFRRLDTGRFARYASQLGHRIVVASHVTASHMLRRPDMRVYLLGLDPYAPLYLNRAANVITTAVDAQTQTDLRALGAKDARVTGPMLALPVADARLAFPQRLEALRAGAPLRIAIATGGSLTHGEQITALSATFSRLTNRRQIERIAVVVGDSRSMQAEVTRAVSADERVAILYEREPTRLVRMADRAIADADVIIAKTGELAFCVAGGKAFKTFHTHPSLGPQEVAIKEYVAATGTRRGQSALEAGLAPAAEVARILAQRESGVLWEMMAAGLSVPADGAHKVVQMIQQDLNPKD